MGDGGFFKGTSAGQDTRFSDKHQKLMRSMKFPKVYSQKVDMKKVSMEVIRGWMVRRIRELLGIDDEVVIEYALGMLQEEVPDPKSMQINLQGFLDKNSQVFVLELWNLLLDAQTSLGGIPRVFIEEKKAELLSSRANKEADLASVRTQEDKEKAVADEIRRKAMEIRQASRPNAASFDNSTSGTSGRRESQAREERPSDRHNRDESSRDRRRDSRDYDPRDRHREHRDYRRERSRSRDAYAGRRNDRYRESSRDRSRDRSIDRQRHGRGRRDYDDRRDSRRRSRSRDYRRDDARRSHYKDARDRSRSGDRNRRGSLDGGHKRKRTPSRSRSRSREGKRDPPARSSRSRSRTPTTKNVRSTSPESSGAPSNGSSGTVTSEAPIDSISLENKLREQLLRERVMHSMMKRKSIDSTKDENL
ncbi:hypothetical protein BG006_011225 [Podila minutissima]|uniref:PWI domain-containing protein n=1 Tax=Podila minutissima TaxID=64525 RepID=A0A9P5SEF3_9FUNG|nr:hypothetical protein BG006_011225 [Podila minutissima]